MQGKAEVSIYARRSAFTHGPAPFCKVPKIFSVVSRLLTVVLKPHR
jgi:hypothetical protein